MLRFVLHKMLNKKWMVLALLVGSVLFIGIAAANPMYTETVLQRTLESKISDYIRENNSYPLVFRAETSGAVINNEVLRIMTEKMDNSEKDFGMPIKEAPIVYRLSSAESVSDLERMDRSTNLTVASMRGMADHISLLSGTGMTESPDADGILDAVVSEKTMIERKMLLGEVLTFNRFTDSAGDPLKIRVAGIFTAKDDRDVYWTRTPDYYTSELFIDTECFTERFLAGEGRNTARVHFYTSYDYSNLKVKDVPAVLDAAESYSEYFEKKLSQSGSADFQDLFTEFLKIEKRVRTTFLVLQVPVFVLLAVFIFMVAAQMLGMEEGEIAVLKSRGANKGQIIGIYFVQSLVTEAAALALGLPLSFFLVRVLASANAFLEFVKRKNLLIVLNRTALLYAIAAALIAVLAMTLPVFKHASTTIVSQKQKKNRKGDMPFWEKYFIDVILLAVSLYGLYSFNNQKSLLSERVLSGEPLDPLLFLSSSIFMLGAGLFILRILPWITRLIFHIFKKQWSPAMYTSFVRITRTKKQQGFIMVFLVMTIAIGVFSAVSARTFNDNDMRNVRYINGADAVIKEKWRDNSFAVNQDESVELVFYEPDYERFSKIPGVQNTTKVVAMNDGILFLSAGKVQNVKIRGIETKKFGETAWFDSSLLGEHWFNYLNVLASRSDTVILSSNFKKLGLKIGDVISLCSKQFDTVTRLIIYGFVDYWPGYVPVTYEKSPEGIMAETDNYLAVINIGRAQHAWGVTPYEVWMDLDGDASGVYEFMENDERTIEAFTDTEDDLIRHNNDAVLQGTNGIMTLGFIVSIVVCAVGFLIYWILSVKSRELQFGIFRAMGMSMREILTILVNEQIFISGGAILGGAVTGALASILFIPLIQIAYSTVDSALPLRLSANAGDMVKLAVVTGVMIVICMIILGVIVRKMKIAQALKLGED